MQLALFKTIALILAMLYTSAFASWNNPAKPFDATKNEVKTVKITWIYVENIQKECNAEFKRKKIDPLTYAVDACSVWEGDTCTIITKKRPTMHDVGHEVRHCFQRYWH